MTDQSHTLDHPKEPVHPPKLTRLQRLREEERKIRSAVGQQMTGYVLTALGLVVGLAWNNAITDAINAVFPNGGGIIVKFVYAFILTLFIGIIAYYITVFFKKEKK